MAMVSKQWAVSSMLPMLMNGAAAGHVAAGMGRGQYNTIQLFY